MKINNLYIVAQIKADRNGNRRYVVHFSALLTREESAAPSQDQFNLALSKARKRGGKVYRGSVYPGGIVFQAYNEPELIAKIAAVKSTQ